MSPQIFVLSAWSPAGATISVGFGNFENQGIISETGPCEHILSREIVILIHSLTLWGSDAQTAVIWASSSTHGHCHEPGFFAALPTGMG